MNMILYPPDSPIAFTIFNFPVRWYGIILSLAIFTGILLSSKLVKKYVSEKDYNIFLDIMPVIVISAIFGARLFYVTGNFDYYIKNPSEILLINHGGISIYGAILFGIGALFIYHKIKNFLILKYLDILALTMPLCQSIGRWGNFFNQEAYGAPYSGFLKMYISENCRYSQLKDIEYYHPAFLYESILDFLLFLILLTVFLKFKNIKTGTITCLYLFLYALIRIFVENIRLDSVLNISNIPIATIISIILMSLALTALFFIYKK